MEYKFLLEVLRAGLYKEFYEDLPQTLIPFLNPEQYGRSILENSSFIVSSAHENPKIHGRGYVARLSGSTAEFLHIWLVMNLGPRPFCLDDRGHLNLVLKPILAKDLFTTQSTTIRFLTKNNHWEAIELPENTYAFNFMASTLVVYHNPKRLNTFDPAAKIQKIVCTYCSGKRKEISDSVVATPCAEDIRNGAVKQMDVFF